MVAVDLKAVEQLATDHASLKAAAGLAKPGKWSNAGTSTDALLIWGECAGSGANPYRVMADLRDLGSKCTCPSRKFPCKHALALLWVHAEAVVGFPPGETPEWVSDWLRRRRGGAAVIAKPAMEGPAKDLAAARLADPVEPEDPKAAARREAAATRRAGDSERAVIEALDALEQWVGDQLRLGLGAFIDDVTARCRRIAARMVDGKAATLAGRIDELPARLLALPAGDRARGAVVELGKLVMLARAFRAAPRDAGTRRAVMTAETRETVLGDNAALRVTALWEVLAEQVQTRRDGLVSQTTWLLNLAADGPRFAMLLDFFPASAGRRGPAFAAGERFAGDLAFFPAPTPLRALLVQRIPAADDADWPAAAAHPAEALAGALLAEPWALDLPILLPAGRVLRDEAGHDWWRADDEAIALPLAEEAPALLRGTALTRTAALWSGNRLTVLAAQTPRGRIGADG